MKTHAFASSGAAGGKAPAFEWIVLDGRDAADRAWLEATDQLDSAVKAIISTAPRRSEHLHLDSAIVMGLVRADQAASDPGPGMHMVIEAQRLTMVSYGMERLVDEVFEQEVARRSPTSISRVLSSLVAALIRRLRLELTDLGDRIDALEDAAMRDSGEPIDDQVVLVGQQVLALRRFLAPLNYEIGYLAITPGELPGTADPRHLRRAADSLVRIVGGLDSAQQRVQLMLDQLRNRNTSRLEKSMHKLTLIATVFLPMGFITGLLGINVAGIPGTHDPYAFWMVCGLMIAVAIGAVLVIRWRRWM